MAAEIVEEDNVPLIEGGIVLFFEGTRRAAAG
jgi:hypothetical protein